jgi:hypothetical protein
LKCPTEPFKEGQPAAKKAKAIHQPDVNSEEAESNRYTTPETEVSEPQIFYNEEEYQLSIVTLQ